jgi:MFS family permease
MTSLPVVTKQTGGFTRLWFASVASNLGDGLVIAALPLLAATFTRDPVAVSGLAAATGLPWLVLGPLSGAIVDRFDRRKLMWWFDLLRAIVVGGLTVFIGMGGESLVVLYAVVFLIAAGETVVDVSAQAILPALVPKAELDAVNGRLFSTMTLANRFVGPPLGGFLFGVAALLPIAADAASFAIAAATVASITGVFKPAVEPAAPVSSVWASVGEGMRWLWGNEAIRAFAIGAALLNIGTYAGESILVLFAQEQLGVGGTGFGALFAATAAGYSGGSFLAPAVVARVARIVVVISSVLTISVSLLVIGLARHWAVVAAGLAGVGLAGGFWDVIAVSFRQAVVPDHLLGRIMAAYRVIAHGSIPIGALLGGITASVGGNRAAFLVGSAVVFLAVPYLVTKLSRVELDPARATV